MHLRYCMWTADECGEYRHPQAVMRALGITYQVSTPQSICDQWWFWNCSGMPSALPAYLSSLDLDPHEQIGYGLSQEGADLIAAYKETI